MFCRASSTPATVADDSARASNSTEAWPPHPMITRRTGLSVDAVMDLLPVDKVLPDQSWGQLYARENRNNTIRRVPIAVRIDQPRQLSLERRRQRSPDALADPFGGRRNVDHVLWPLAALLA